jgi:hypothetical protein
MQEMKNFSSFGGLKIEGLNTNNASSATPTWLDNVAANNVHHGVEKEEDSDSESTELDLTLRL